MTKYWGPLGWATLHTVAALYPENPTQSEIQLAYNWLDTFAECITCASCQGHFKKMLSVYRSRYPDMLSSRRNLILFTLRAHNTVNRRIGQKVYSLAESWSTLERLFNNDSARRKRREYLIYLQRDWGRQSTMVGITMLMKIRDLNMAESEYWTKSVLDWNVAKSDIPDEVDVVTPIVPISGSSQQTAKVVIQPPQRFKFKSMSVASSSLISR